MNKVKIIKSDGESAFENKINEFLKCNPDIKLIDIKLTMSNYSSLAMIIYKSVEP